MMLHSGSALMYIQCRYTSGKDNLVTSIQRWGNSLAIRIPKAFAEQAQLDENSAVEISIDGDRITVAPARVEWKLEDLVRRISPRNAHREVKWGEQSGKEAW